MILDIKHLRLAYGAHVLAPDVTFHLEGGECVLLAGANGCGKSTLLKVLAGEGVVSQTHGHPRPCPVRAGIPSGIIGGKSFPEREGPTAASASDEALRVGRGRSEAKAVWGTIPSSAKCILIPTGIPKVKGFTVEAFVRTGCFKESDWAGRLSEESERRLQGALDLLVLRAQAGQDIATLSDGEFQKACIAVGLTRRADVLLLDEPTAFLDVENRVMVLRTLRKVAQETGMAVLFSSHDLHDALQVVHRVLAFTPAGTFQESTQKNRREILQAAFPVLDSSLRSE